MNIVCTNVTCCRKLTHYIITLQYNKSVYVNFIDFQKVYYFFIFINGHEHRMILIVVIVIWILIVS